MDSIFSRPRQDDYSDGTINETRLIIGEEPLSPPSTPLPTTKRHQKVSSNFAHMLSTFSHSKDSTFLTLLNQIQSRLAELHDGTDGEYLRQVAVLEDQRDKELLEIEAARGFALERVEREYQEEKRLAEKELQVRPDYPRQSPGYESR